MTAMNCTPSGCQCQCHNPPLGIEIKHLVPCCGGKPTAETTWWDDRGIDPATGRYTCCGLDALGDSRHHHWACKRPNG